MVSTPIQIRFQDIDMAGHVHNAMYLHYFEQGRIDFFRKLVTGDNWDWKRQSLILARNEIDYKIPVRLTDQISVVTHFMAVTTKTVILRYEIIKQTDSEPVICAEGRSVLVCYDFEKGESIEVPEPWKKVFYGLSVSD